MWTYPLLNFFSDYTRYVLHLSQPVKQVIDLTKKDGKVCGLTVLLYQFNDSGLTTNHLLLDIKTYFVLIDLSVLFYLQ